MHPAAWLFQADEGAGRIGTLRKIGYGGTKGQAENKRAENTSCRTDIRQIAKHADRQKDVQTDRQADRIKLDRWSDIHTYTNTNRQRHRDTPAPRKRDGQWYFFHNNIVLSVWCAKCLPPSPPSPPPLLLTKLSSPLSLITLTTSMRGLESTTATVTFTLQQFEAGLKASKMVPGQKFYNFQYLSKLVTVTSFSVQSFPTSAVTHDFYFF